MSQVSESAESVKIEYEQDGNENEENEESIEIKAPIEGPTGPAQAHEKKVEPKTTIARKRICDLTEQEKAQLINDAKAGKENNFYHVKLFKNGNTRITLKKQSKAQELIQSNETNVEKVLTPTSRYLTDNQLLFEHVLNLETQYSKLRSKHRKLKKRFCDLEGYLYANDSDSDDEKEKPIKAQKQIQENVMKEPIQQQQQQSIPQQQPQSSNPFVQRRYVRSWRMINPIQNQV